LSPVLLGNRFGYSRTMLRPCDVTDAELDCCLPYFRKATREVSESIDYNKVWEALLWPTPRDILANASTGLLWVRSCCRTHT
jgi:hypothetical protein